MSLPTEYIRPPVQDRGYWLVWLGILLVPLVGLAAWWFAPDISDSSRYVGVCLGIAFWLWLALYALGLKHRAPVLQGCLFGGFWLALILGGLLGGERRKQEMQAAAAALLADVDQMSDAVLTDNPQVIANPFDKPVTATGTAGELQRFTRDFLGEMVAIRNAQITDLERIGWPRIFAGERLLEDRRQDFRDSRRMQTEALASLDKHEQQALALYQDLEQRIARYDLSAEDRIGVLRGAHAGKEANIDRIRRIVELDRQMMRLMGEQIELLRGSADWQVEGEQILFSADELLAEFNALGTRVETLMADQEKLQREGLERGRSRLEKLAR